MGLARPRLRYRGPELQGGPRRDRTLALRLRLSFTLSVSAPASPSPSPSPSPHALALTLTLTRTLAPTRTLPPRQAVLAAIPPYVDASGRIVAHVTSSFRARCLEDKREA